jgi:hypothetical protein
MSNPLSVREQTDRLRAVPLPAVLLAAGAVPDRQDKTRWRTSTGTISVTGCKFFDWNRGRGGGGAIDLVMHLYGLGFTDALTWLRGRFAHQNSVPVPRRATKPPLKLPVQHPRRLSAVTCYLTRQRRIPPVLVDRLVNSGSLYADARANAVFLLLGNNNAAVGAELRGTGPHPWHGMAPGSDKNLGFFSVRDIPTHAVILCESAIDAISCIALHPGHWCISTAGARSHPAWLPDIIRHGLPLYCGFDADPTGDHMASVMIHNCPCIHRLRPPRHDWNNALTSLS